MGDIINMMMVGMRVIGKEERKEEEKERILLGTYRCQRG
jgi:hypothetical protein